MQYQIVQKDYNVFRITLLLESEEYTEEIIEVIEERIREKISEQILIEFDIVKEVIVCSETGKLACFICEIK